MHFTLKQLRYFAVAGELNSVTRAAEELHVSQPSISFAIQQLEEASGLQFFVRHHAQGLSLTPNGKKFLVKAKQLLSHADGLGHYAVTLGEEVSGTLKIAGFPTFTPILMPRLIKQFVTKYPAVDVQCEEMHHKEIIEGLQDARFELAVTYDLQIPADISFRPLLEFPTYAAMSLDHPLADRDEVSIRELAEYPMVLLDWPASREYFYSLFLAEDVEPNFAYKAQSLGMVRGLVANGFGYTFFNTPLATNLALDGTPFRCARIRENLRPLRLGIAYLSQSQLTPTTEAFIRELEIQTRELSDTLFTDAGVVEEA